MRSAIGWTLLSKEALKRAETQLREDVQGVRDEIGFLAVHQAYADRFFPGTSVLQTRLRYALFVPWLYERLRGRRGKRRLDALLEREEVVLAGRLKSSGEDGVIGGRSYPRPTTQPASMVYWTALGTWRILRPLRDGSYPGRSAVHRLFSSSSDGERLRDDDRQVMSEREAVFAALPTPPSEWDDQRAVLDLSLVPAESNFLRGCLLAVLRPKDVADSSEGGRSPSLFSRLVDRRVPLRDRTQLWAATISAAADVEDKDALQRARQAASLSAIGRGIYAALVESIRDRDGRATPDVHRRNLREVVDEYRARALRLDVEAVRRDAPRSMNQGILTVMRETQGWLRRPGQKPDGLLEVYGWAEQQRKGRRARLAMTIAGRERRSEWDAEEHPLASPLHYRWANVRRLLMDLEDGS